MQSLDQQLNSLSVVTRPLGEVPVDTAGGVLPVEERAQWWLPFSKGLLWRRGRWFPRLAMGLGLALSVGVASAVATVHHRYSDRGLDNIALLTEPVDNHAWQGEGISFQQQDGNYFDVSFQLSDASSESGAETPLFLRDIDLTLLMPEVPATARNNQNLTRWFLTEREFNRQRVIFEPGSVHIDLPEGLAGYRSEDVSIALTNNCLGAGYWELAVSVLTEEGQLEKVYQGYFTFPRGVYAEIISWLNPSHYWQQARTMEAWPGFQFLSGLPFALDELRQVHAETAVPVTDLKTEEILAADEQIKKENLIVYANDGEADQIQTWEDLRQADLKFQSFVVPGVYDEARLWTSDFSQLSTVVQATGRQITSPLSADPLIEVEIDFESDAGDLRQLIISGIDWDEVPRLDSVDYPGGVYVPLGFGTAFTQSYTELEANPPALSPFFSVVLDADNQVIDYRQEIGINGLVMHRDIDDPNLLHVYPMSYERITLIGHYVVDLDLYALSDTGSESLWD